MEFNPKKYFQHLSNDERVALIEIFKRVLLEKKPVTVDMITRLSDNPKELTQARLANWIGEQVQIFAVWNNKGCPRNADGTYNLRDFFQWYKNRQKKKLEGSGGKREGEEIRRISAQATLAEIKIDEAQSRLVDRADVLRVIGEHITTASKRIQDIPHILARSIPSSDRKKFIDDANREIGTILKELARGDWKKSEGKIPEEEKEDE